MSFDGPQKAHIGAVVLLILASMFCAYRWYYAQMELASAGLTALSEILRTETDVRTAQPSKTRNGERVGMPELLSQIQDAASSYNIGVHNVAPNLANSQRLSLGVRGSFRDMIAFLGRLETLQVTVAGFDFAPDDGGVASNIELELSGKLGAPASFADYVDALVNYSAVRDPFEIGDPVPLPNVGSDLGDLSWIYHLTSISQYGAERAATIDGKDYHIGEHLGTLLIVAIGPSSVSLSAPRQPLVQKLHFRRNPRGSGHAD